MTITASDLRRFVSDTNTTSPVYAEEDVTQAISSATAYLARLGQQDITVPDEDVKQVLLLKAALMLTLGKSTTSSSTGSSSGKVSEIKDGDVTIKCVTSTATEDVEASTKQRKLWQSALNEMIASYDTTLAEVRYHDI